MTTTPSNSTTPRGMSLQSQLTAANETIKRLELSNVERIKHLNRLATWAQQDPTGPWDKLEIQKWVLNEIRAAFGQEPLPQLWQPESVKISHLQETIKTLTELADGLAENLELITQDMTFSNGTYNTERANKILTAYTQFKDGQNKESKP